METEKDTFHVVIRLPFKRPAGFIEPPAIVWTDEMEHKLWQYMSQKNTDWSVIAEQLGVPTSYIVRHAAFIYETQLRGIHQQLRLNTNTASISSRNSAKSPTSTKSTRPTSIRYSNSLQYQQQYIPSNQQDTTALQPRSMDNSGSMQKSMITSQSPKRAMSSTSLHNSSSLYKSSSTTTNTTTHANQQSTITAYVNDTSEEEEDIHLDNHSNESSNSSSSHHHNEMKDEEEEEEEEQEFGSHFARMKLQVEEPAFLPHRHDNSDSNSLSNSRQQLSISIQNLRKQNSMETPITSPNATSANQASTAPGSSNESAMNSIGSSFSDLSDSSVTQSALEEAFLSKFNQGSKMSTMLNFSRRQ